LALSNLRFFFRFLHMLSVMGCLFLIGPSLPPQIFWFSRSMVVDFVFVLSLLPFFVKSFLVWYFIPCMPHLSVLQAFPVLLVTRPCPFFLGLRVIPMLGAASPLTIFFDFSLPLLWGLLCLSMFVAFELVCKFDFFSARR